MTLLLTWRYFLFPKCDEISLLCIWLTWKIWIGFISTAGIKITLIMKQMMLRQRWLDSDSHPYAAVPLACIWRLTRPPTATTCQTTFNTFIVIGSLRYESNRISLCLNAWFVKCLQPKCPDGPIREFEPRGSSSSNTLILVYDAHGSTCEATEASSK